MEKARQTSKTKRNALWHRAHFPKVLHLLRAYKREIMFDPHTDFDHLLTHQSLNEKFESPFDLVLHAIQLVREQIALQQSGAVIHTENLAQKVLQDISQEPDERIEPIFEVATTPTRPTAPAAPTRDDARRASARKKRRLPKAGQKV